MTSDFRWALSAASSESKHALAGSWACRWAEPTPFFMGPAVLRYILPPFFVIASQAFVN